MRPSRLTEAQLVEALRLREEDGLAYVEIGRRFGVSCGCIAWHCLTNGVEPPPDKRRPAPIPVRGGCFRGGREVRAYTAAEDAFILDMQRSGFSPHRTGRQMTPQRTSSSVLGRLHTLARHDARAEVLAA